MERKIVYFKTPGKVNTDLTLKVARQRCNDMCSIPQRGLDNDISGEAGIGEYGD